MHYVASIRRPFAEHHQCGKHPGRRTSDDRGRHGYKVSGIQAFVDDDLPGLNDSLTVQERAGQLVRPAQHDPLPQQQATRCTQRGFRCADCPAALGYYDRLAEPHERCFRPKLDPRPHRGRASARVVQNERRHLDHLELRTGTDLDLQLKIVARDQRGASPRQADARDLTRATAPEWNGLPRLGARQIG